MKYAFLLYPHQNVRYRQSLLTIASAELSMTLAALGRGGEVRTVEMGGAPFLTFDVLHVPVYVEMVGIHSRDYGHGREELQEGAVELVRLGHYDRIVAYEQVGVIVLGYASEEG